MTAVLSVRIGLDPSFATQDLALFVRLPDGSTMICALNERDCDWTIAKLRRDGIDAADAIKTAIAATDFSGICYRREPDWVAGYVAFERSRAAAEAGIVALDGTLAEIVRAAA